MIKFHLNNQNNLNHSSQLENNKFESLSNLSARQIENNKLAMEKEDLRKYLLIFSDFKITIIDKIYISKGM